MTAYYVDPSGNICEAQRKIYEQARKKGIPASEAYIIATKGKNPLNNNINYSKPKNSPDSKKWFDKGRNISVDKNTGVWIYYDWEGNSVSYVGGYPDFKSAGLVIQEIDLETKFKGRTQDFALGDKLLKDN